MMREFLWLAFEILIVYYFASVKRGFQSLSTLFIASPPIGLNIELSIFLLSLLIKHREIAFLLICPVWLIEYYRYKTMVYLN